MATVLRIALLVVAAAWLLYVGLSSGEPEYVAPTLETAVAHEPAPTELTRAVPANCVVRTFEVAGMCCAGCTGKLFEWLTAVPEVREAAVSFEAGRAQAVVPEDFDARVLEAALTREKYTARLDAPTSD
jgi:hypothetical protein